MDRNRLGHRLDDKPYQLRGRNGRAACQIVSGSSLGKSTSVIDEVRAESRHRMALRPRQELAVIEVPSALGLHPSGVQDAPDALREAGLHRLVKPTEVIRVDVPLYSPARDTKTHVLNAEGISILAMRVADRVQTTIGDGRFPLVLGGDRSIVLGPLLALRRRGRYGLAFIDCHADFWHPFRPGGLMWKEAESMLRSILQIPKVAGLDVTIFNPRLDPDGELTNRLAALIVGGVASIRNVL